MYKVAIHRFWEASHSKPDWRKLICWNRAVGATIQASNWKNMLAKKQATASLPGMVNGGRRAYEKSYSYMPQSLPHQYWHSLVSPPCTAATAATCASEASTPEIRQSCCMRTIIAALACQQTSRVRQGVEDSLPGRAWPLVTTSCSLLPEPWMNTVMPIRPPVPGLLRVFCMRCTGTLIPE